MNFKLFKNRTFTLFVLGSVITIMGDNFLNISLALYVLHITGSAAKFAFVVALISIPSIILGPISGSLVDRFNKKKILIFFDFIRGAILILFIILNSKSGFSLESIYIISFAFGICGSIYQPCIVTVLPSIVEKKELIDGNAIYRIFLQIGQVISPTLAALIYNAKGISFVAFIDAITFLFMALVAVFYKIQPTSSNNTKSILENIKDGFKLFKDKEILSLSINGTLSYLFVLPLFSIGFPYIIKNIFSGTDQDYATVQTVISIASICIVFSIPMISKKMRELKALNLTMFGMLAGISIMILLGNNLFFNYLASNDLYMIIFLSIVAFIFYLSFSTYGVFFLTVNQKKVSQTHFGRYYSILIMMFSMGNVLGSSMYGLLFDTKIVLYPVLVAIVGMTLKLLLNRTIVLND